MVFRGWRRSMEEVRWVGKRGGGRLGGCCRLWRRVLGVLSRCRVVAGVGMREDGVVRHRGMRVVARHDREVARCGLWWMARRDTARTRALPVVSPEAILWLTSCARKMWRASGYGGLVKSFGRM